MIRHLFSLFTAYITSLAKKLTFQLILMTYKNNNNNSLRNQKVLNHTTNRHSLLQVPNGSRANLGHGFNLENIGLSWDEILDDARLLIRWKVRLMSNFGTLE